MGYKFKTKNQGGNLNTDTNLEKSFASEAQTSIRYSAYASIAEKEGYRQVALMFKALAEAEKVRAINTLKAIGELEKTSDNLYAAVDGKTFDFTQRYPAYIEQAEIDDEQKAKDTFQTALNIAKNHIKLLHEALDNLGRNKDHLYWVCAICGNIDTEEMPVSCKMCGVGREKFTKVEQELEYQ
jgi:rubrerythrin